MQKSPVRRIKLFRRGRHQMLRMSREFKRTRKTALMEGPRCRKENKPQPVLLAVLDGLCALDEEFPEIDDGLPRLIEF
jgi:hypothetical protein